MTQAKILLFNRWDTSGITLQDPGLRPYIDVAPIVVPRSAGRFTQNYIHKHKLHIVERFVNKMMVPGHKSKKHFKTSGHITGKAHTAYGIVEDAFKLIEKNTKENPIKVFVKALENAAQREEIITIEYGGARYPKTVECSPQRRVDLVLRHFTQGAYHKTFNTKKSIVNTLAEEITNAFRMNAGSHAISKKLEIERQADSSR